jgi:hypothetical protein
MPYQHKPVDELQQKESTPRYRARKSGGPIIGIESPEAVAAKMEHRAAPDLGWAHIQRPYALYGATTPVAVLLASLQTRPPGGGRAQPGGGCAP